MIVVVAAPATMTTIYGVHTNQTRHGVLGGSNIIGGI